MHNRIGSLLALGSLVFPSLAGLRTLAAAENVVFRHGGKFMSGSLLI
jgi:hypothetical protein